MPGGFETRPCDNLYRTSRFVGRGRVFFGGTAVPERHHPGNLANHLDLKPVVVRMHDHVID